MAKKVNGRKASNECKSFEHVRWPKYLAFKHENLKKNIVRQESKKLQKLQLLQQLLGTTSSGKINHSAQSTGDFPVCAASHFLHA